jgi:hypothetical protein
MANPNPNYTQLSTLTLERRSKTIADNVKKHIPLLSKLRDQAERPVSGGTKILEPMAWAENGNFMWGGGADPIPMTQQDLFAPAEFNLKYAYCGLVVTGEEDLANSGPEAELDLMTNLIRSTETTIENKVNLALFSDGTGSGGKEITGLAAAVPVDPTTGTYGGIDRSTTNGTFWRSKLQTAAGYASTTIQGYMMALWLKLVRNTDKPDLILFDDLLYTAFWASLTPNQRFEDPKMADLGFQSLRFMSAPVVMAGGSNGSNPANSGWFLNTKYLHWRPHSRRNFVPIGPKNRVPFNQDLQGTIFGVAAQLTCSGAMLQGFLKGY